jgi:eukaryotic-like serine/threonine-protein kinase
MEASADRRLVAGRYVLGGPLGRGGMGTVWRADDVLLGRPVAVKEVELPAGSADAGRAALRERALREARAAARLNHPGVVTLHDVVEADGRLLLVMELVAAPSLGELVERSGPLPPAVAARLGLELVDALEAAHRAGIVHHDVKPANVMVTAAGRAKLADFGIASLQEDGQRTLAALGGPGGRAADRTLTTAFGSLPYVAPEQAAGRAGPAADLWALGATLWFAVEGAAPFERAHPAAGPAAILHDPPGRPVRAGPSGPALLALLDKDPARRPPAAVVRRLLEPLASAAPAPTVPLAGPTEVLPSPAPAPGWGEPRPPRVRRRAPEPLPGWTAPRPRRRWVRRLLVAAAVLVLLLAAANAIGDAARRADPGPAGLGDPVRDGQFQFVVRSVDCGARSVGQGFGRQQALGQFCLVALQVENTGSEGRTFGGGQQHLFDLAGRRHDPDLAATARHGGGRLLSTHLNPGQRLSGTLVYDVPERVEPARVELHDAPFSRGASVMLG